MVTSKWKSEVIRLRVTEGLDWTEVVAKVKDHFPGLTEAQIRKRLYDLVSRYKKREDTVSSKVSVGNGYNKEKGIYENDRLITICETDEITPELMLNLHHLNPDNWSVISYKNNFWHSQVKGGKRLIMYQSKLLARPKIQEISFDDISNFFATTNLDVKHSPVTPLMYDPSGDTLEICVADLHNGMYAWIAETGANYDVDIAREFMMRAVADILGRCEGRKFKKIILALLGDILHTDNDQQSTTKGTLQQVDGREPRVFTKTLELLVEVVDIFTAIAPVEVVYTRGNHDYLLGWALIKCLEQAYREGHPNVEIDVSPDTQKARLIGKVLVGYVHGSMSEKNLSGWLQVYARKMDTPIAFMEVHSGHRHDLKVKERIQTESVEGVVVRTMPALCNSSAWSHNEGMVAAMQAVVCFVYGENCGLREQWYCLM